MSTPVPTWTPPNRAEIIQRNQDLNLGMSAEMIDVAEKMAPGLAPAFNRVASWWADVAPVPAPVPFTPGNDPWNATQYKINVAGSCAGTLAELRLAAKDSIRIAGVPMAYGSRLIAGHNANVSATVIERALAAGATFTHTGKSDDLGLAITGDQNYTGPVLNPWNPSYSTWGSSSGAGALVAANLVDAAIMVDQAGSCRAPAAGCGLAALVPTRGTIPMTGILGFTTTQDRVGVGSRFTRIVAAVASVLSGSDGKDIKAGSGVPPQNWAVCPGGGQRLGVVTESLDPALTDPAVATLVRARVDELARRGNTVTEVSIPSYTDAVPLALVLTVQRGIIDLLGSNAGSDSSVLFGDPRLVEQFDQRRTTNPEYLARTGQISMADGAFNGGQPDGWWIAAAMDLIPHLIADYTAALEGIDLLVTPTVPSIPPTVPGPDMTLLEELARAIGPGITHTCAANLTGLPAGTCPAGLIGGLPVGVMFTGAAHAEEAILRAMATLEPQGGFPAAPGAVEPGVCSGC